MPSAERRRQIAAAALELVGREGPTAITTRRLAAAVELTTGALFRHFQSLGDVWQAAVEDAAMALENTFPDPAAPPLERLLDLLEARLELLRVRPGVAWLLRSEQALAVLPPSSAARLETLIRQTSETLIEALEQARDEGQIRSDLTPTQLLAPLTGAVHVLAGNSGLHGRAGFAHGPSAEEVRATLRTLIAPQ